MPSDPPVLRPWTIKAMPEALTQKAVAAAKRRQETVAELVTRALARELDSPTVLHPANQQVIPTNGSDLDELEQLAKLARLLTEPGQRSRALSEARRLVAWRLRAISKRWEGEPEPPLLDGPDAEESPLAE